jgi:hypothetical protein
MQASNVSVGRSQRTALVEGGEIMTMIATAAASACLAL